jgi:hypothetical protein
VNIKTISCVRDDATDSYVQTVEMTVPRSALMAEFLATTGEDGLGDPSDSKGQHQVVFADGTFVICSYAAALEHSQVNPDYTAMISVSALRAALRQALN